MLPFTFKTKLTGIYLRQAEQNDLPRLIKINDRAFPLMVEENVVWSERQLNRHLKLFPQGQIVAEISSSSRSTCEISKPMRS